MNQRFGLMVLVCLLIWACQPPLQPLQQAPIQAPQKPALTQNTAAQLDAQLTQRSGAGFEQINNTLIYFDEQGQMEASLVFNPKPMPADFKTKFADHFDFLEYQWSAGDYYGDIDVFPHDLSPGASVLISLDVGKITSQEVPQACVPRWDFYYEGELLKTFQAPFGGQAGERYYSETLTLPAFYNKSGGLYALDRQMKLVRTPDTCIHTVDNNTKQAILIPFGKRQSTYNVSVCNEHKISEQEDDVAEQYRDICNQWRTRATRGTIYCKSQLANQLDAVAHQVIVLQERLDRLRQDSFEEGSLFQTQALKQLSRAQTSPTRAEFRDWLKSLDFRIQQVSPSGNPSSYPSADPSSFPSNEPSSSPSEGPSASPSGEPSPEPSETPTPAVTPTPTPEPIKGNAGATEPNLDELANGLYYLEAVADLLQQFHDELQNKNESIVQAKTGATSQEDLSLLKVAQNRLQVLNGLQDYLDRLPAYFAYINNELQNPEQCRLLNAPLATPGENLSSISSAGRISVLQAYFEDNPQSPNPYKKDLVIHGKANEWFNLHRINISNDSRVGLFIKLNTQGMVELPEEIFIPNTLYHEPSKQYSFHTTFGSRNILLGNNEYFTIKIHDYHFAPQWNASKGLEPENVTSVRLFEQLPIQISAEIHKHWQELPFYSGNEIVSNLLIAPKYTSGVLGAPDSGVVPSLDGALIFSPRDQNGLLDKLSFSGVPVQYDSWQVSVSGLNDDSNIQDYVIGEASGFSSFLEWDGFIDGVCLIDGKYQYTTSHENQVVSQTEFYVDNTPPIVQNLDIQEQQTGDDPNDPNDYTSTIRFEVGDPVIRGAYSQTDIDALEVYIDQLPYNLPTQDDDGFWITGLIDDNQMRVELKSGSQDTYTVEFTLPYRLEGHTLEVRLQDKAHNTARYLLSTEGVTP